MTYVFRYNRLEAFEPWKVFDEHSCHQVYEILMKSNTILHIRKKGSQG